MTNSETSQLSTSNYDHQGVILSSIIFCTNNLIGLTMMYFSVSELISNFCKKKIEKENPAQTMDGVKQPQNDLKLTQNNDLEVVDFPDDEK